MLGMRYSFSLYTSFNGEPERWRCVYSLAALASSWTALNQVLNGRVRETEEVRASGDDVGQRLASV